MKGISDTSHHRADSQFAEFSIDVPESKNKCLLQSYHVFFDNSDMARLRESQVSPQK